MEKHDTTHPWREAVIRACHLLGSQRALAMACSVNQHDIWRSVHTSKRLPAWLAVRICEATGDQVTIRELLPDVWAAVERQMGSRL